MVGSANDPLEREADRVAELVMRTWSSRSAGACAEDGGEPIQRLANPGHDPVSAFPADDSVAKRLAARTGGGQVLPAVVRNQMEAGFGTDFSSVRIHRDAEAADLSTGLAARAFTHGTDIYFAAGAYEPGSRSGRHLLAHELTHVVQQGGAPVHRTSEPRPAELGDGIPDTGRRDGQALISHEVTHTVQHAASPAVQRGQIGERPVVDAYSTLTTDPASFSILRNAVANSLSASAAQFLRLQRLYGNRAVQELLQCARGREIQWEGKQRKHPTPHGDELVQRKFDFLAEANLTKSLGNERAAELSQMIVAYNETPDWQGLASDELLQAQVKADSEALTAMERLVKAVSPIKAMQPEWKTNGEPLLNTLAAHQRAVKKEIEAIARRAEAAKPLKEKHLKGLLQGAKNKYEALVGDAKDMAEVSEPDLKEILALYGPHGTGKEAWEREAKLREREKTAVGGQRGWVTELLTRPKKHPRLDEVMKLIGPANKSEDLSIETMIRILDALHPAVENNAKEVWEFFARQVDKRAATEPSPAVQEKVSGVRERSDQLRAEALARLGGGKTWVELAPAIEKWWAAVQEAAKLETFATVFQAGRMTVRCIAKGGSAQGGTFKAMRPVGESGTETGQADMTLERGRESISQRTNPATWTGADNDMEVKRKKGLYELSASLLDPRRDIFTQLKFYQSPEAVVFMPAASPEDSQIFSAISTLADLDQPRLREIGSQMTRIILAQSTDMGTKYVDKSPGNQGTDIHYGETGTVIRYAGGRGMAARSHEIEARRTNALLYTGILDDPKKLVNEVVVEYRKHASGKFPLFTEIDHKNKQFHIVDSATFERTGRYIDNKGVEHGR